MEELWHLLVLFRVQHLRRNYLVLCVPREDLQGEGCEGQEFWLKWEAT